MINQIITKYMILINFLNNMNDKNYTKINNVNN
jgi:hypothetical protein